MLASGERLLCWHCLDLASKRHEVWCFWMCLISINHVVAVLGLILALGSYIVLKHYGVPDKVAFGAGVLSAIVVAIFWSCVMLGTEEDDE